MYSKALEAEFFLNIEHKDFSAVRYDLTSASITKGNHYLKICNYRGESALFLATRIEAYDIASYLLDNGANPNFSGNTNTTIVALCADKACDNNDEDALHLLERLIHLGANLEQWDGGRKAGSLLHFALEFSKPAVVRELVKGKADLEPNGRGYWPIHVATDAKVLKELLEHPEAVVDRIDELGCTSLFYAAKKNDYESVSILLKRGA